MENLCVYKSYIIINILKFKTIKIMSILQTSLKTLKQMKYQVGFFVSELGGGTKYSQRV